MVMFDEGWRNKVFVWLRWRENELIRMVSECFIVCGLML